MRIAVVHSYYSSQQPSGENVVVDAQVAALREAGHDVAIIARRTDELQHTRGYKARSAGSVATGIGESPIAELTAFAPDVLHVHNLFPNWGTRWLQEWRGPVVATLHNFRAVCAAGTLYRAGKSCTLCPDRNSLSAIVHACYRGSRTATLPLAVRNFRGVAGDAVLSRADRVVVLSPRAFGLFSGFGLSLEKTVVIPNFVDSADFTPQAPVGREWVYIGRLSEEKGIRTLLKDWPDNQILNIYGEGELRLETEGAVAGRTNLRYHGKLNHSQVASVLARARGLVFPSECAEGAPLVYLEALAAGRAVIAREGNGAADDVAKAGAGVTYTDSIELKDALALSTRQLVTYGRTARLHYEATYTQQRWLESTERLYREIAPDRGSIH
jgi:glycosyltransferase involved in cell wall biosynthesis